MFLLQVMQVVWELLCCSGNLMSGSTGISFPQRDVLPAKLAATAWVKLQQGSTFIIPVLDVESPPATETV